MRGLLEPAREGRDLGLLSDAGCPGVADPGAALVAAAHDLGLTVVPLVGPSAILLALMASGMNGQQFCFHGYLPADSPGRLAALRRLEAESRARGVTQVAIETPYRNPALLEAMLATFAARTRLCVAVDLTLPGESVISRTVREWPRGAGERYAKRPAMFVFEAAQ
jgi:16S rRNA (cytidine1402-2'-O)-methyltransferase